MFTVRAYALLLEHSEPFLGVEVADPPLSLHRQQLLLHYASKLAGLADNPAYHAVYGERDQISGRELRNFGDFADRLQQCCTT